MTQFWWVYGNLYLSQIEMKFILKNNTFVVFLMWNKGAVSKWQFINPSEPVHVDVHYMGIWVI